MTAPPKERAAGPATFGDSPLRYLARVTITLDGPLAVSSGQALDTGGADVVRDANGLPAIPGSSLAGILRHAFEDSLSDLGQDEAEQKANRLFGPPVEIEDGHASRLSVTWAHIHDSKDRPVDGLLSPGDDRQADLLLADAREGRRRDRVRLSHRGAADGRGKFEDWMVAAGHRFTFDLCLRGDEADAPDWRRLLGLLFDPGVRLGGGTRHGRGAFTVERLRGGRLDLRTADDFAVHGTVPSCLSAPFPLPPLTIPAVTARPGLRVTLRGLRADSPWLPGGGVPEGAESMAPVRERRVVWRDDRGAVEETPVHYLPATGIKGALAHRLAWHYNALTGTFADDIVDFAEVTGAKNAAVWSLLGFVPLSREERKESPGRRGWLVLDDVVLAAPAATQQVEHVSLDRFAGGARNGLLFSERVLDPEALRADYTIHVIPPLTGTEEADSDIRKALARTLKDIERGRLALGGGTGRGNGRMRCDAIDWSDGGTWIETGTLPGQWEARS